MMLNLNLSNGKCRQRTPSVVSWAVGFEKVLEDSMGLRTFTEFLKREFSSENIKFWMLCEKYRTQSDKHQRKTMAVDIIQSHVCAGAVEPVNIDSQSRQIAIEGLNDATQDLFLPAQKQIFNLMKFDCYQRFLKSDLFLESLTAEKLGKPLPCEECLDCAKKCRSRSKSRHKNRLGPSNESSLELKSAANDVRPERENGDEEKKRKSLFPWQKGRGKSSEFERSSSRSPVLRERNTNFRDSRRKNGDKSKSKDLIANEALQTSLEKQNPNQSNQSPSQEKNTIPPDLCRVTFQDSWTALLSTTNEELLAKAIHQLMLKHSMPPMIVEAHIKNRFQILDLETPLSHLGGQEVCVGLKTFFKLQLPSTKIIAVKCRPEKTCQEILQPILEKYGFDLGEVEFHLATTQTPVNLSGPISAVNRCQINVRLKSCTEVSLAKEVDQIQRMTVTSSLFEDVIEGKLVFLYDELGIMNLENSQKVLSSSNKRESACDLSSLSIQDKLKFSSPEEKVLQRNGKKEIRTTTNNTATKNVHYRDSSDFTAVWNRTQKRLDDQRGIELNCELPHFLRPPLQISESHL